MRVLIFFFVISIKGDHLGSSDDPINWDERPELQHPNLGAEYKEFHVPAIACDSPYCAEVSKEIIRQGGTIAEGAIAGMVCMGAIHPQSSGIGGGLVAVYYERKSSTATVLSARERAPLAANESMFDSLPKNSADFGWHAVAVPGEIKGFHELYKKWGGSVPWGSLFKPTIRILEQGVQIDSHLAGALKRSAEEIKKDAYLSSTFMNRNGQVYNEKDVIRFSKLAETLKMIAGDGAESFYNPNSNLGKKILADLKKHNSIITAQDLSNYGVKWQKAVKHSLNGGTTFTSGPPSTGAALIFVLRILKHYRGTLKKNDLRTAQILVEAYKHTWGRMSHFGDPDDPEFSSVVENHIKLFTESEPYLKTVLDKMTLTSTNQNRSYYQDRSTRSVKSSGTAHIAIVGRNGDAISVTTTIGKFFGAKVASEHTGIIFNNKMNNFDKNPRTRKSSPNKISGGKRPMSTACPTICIDGEGIVRVAIGGVGGDKILTAVANVLLHKLYLQDTFFNSVTALRLHHELTPMELEYEPGYPQHIIDGLRKYGHKVKETRPVASVVGISRPYNFNIWAICDSRKPCSIAGF